MSRKIILIDRSPTLGKIIAAKIRAHIGDAVILEANCSEKALHLIKEHRCNLIVYLWDGFEFQGFMLFETLQRLPPEQQVPFLLLTTSDHQETILQIEKIGISDYLSLPCPPQLFAETLHRVCNPFALRRDRRYAVQDTLFLLEQRGAALQGSVINVSLGGMLCELPYSDQFNWALPATASINFSFRGKNTVAPHLYSVVVHLAVIHRHADFSPRKLRIAFRFLQVPLESRRVMEDVFSQTEELEQTEIFSKSIADRPTITAGPGI
jgi:CheY-like chemotaxis protein